jgi:hypothetical protein
LRSRCPRHFVPGYDRTVPPGLEGKPLRGNKSGQNLSQLGAILDEPLYDFLLD